jgi:hypothetical protein
VFRKGTPTGFSPVTPKLSFLTFNMAISCSINSTLQAILTFLGLSLLAYTPVNLALLSSFDQSLSGIRAQALEQNPQMPYTHL